MENSRQEIIQNQQNLLIETTRSFVKNELIQHENLLEKTNKFHQLTENRKKDAEQKITRLKENALKDIKNISVKISMQAAENIIKNSVDKNKLEKFYTESLEQTRTSLKRLRS